MLNRPQNISHPLSILLWNANGLIHQINEIKAFLSQTDIDILLISESHLTNNSCCKIPGYTTYQCNSWWYSPCRLSDSLKIKHQTYNPSNLPKKYHTSDKHSPNLKQYIHYNFIGLLSTATKTKHTWPPTIFQFSRTYLYCRRRFQLQTYVMGL